MPGNGFDPSGAGILRSLNIDLDRQNRQMRLSLKDLTQKNAMVIALLRALVGKYGVGGELSVTRPEVDRVNPNTVIPVIYMKANELDISISLEPGGPKGDAPRSIITLDS